MTRIAGVDFYRRQWDDGITNGDGIKVMVSKGVRFAIAKAGQAYFLDSRWDEHKAKLDAIGGAFLKGAYWFLERDYPAVPPAGFFYPPYSGGQDYITSSYGKGWTTASHGHNNYAVDFNLVGGGDEGKAVRAVADGTVGASTLGWDDTLGASGAFFTSSGGAWQTTYGTRFIDHDGGYRTQYTHMKNILVNAGDTVTRGQKIGEISTVGSSGAGDPAYAHLHHAHYKRSSGGSPYVPIQMRLLGKAMTASRANTWSKAFSPNRWTGQTVTGVSDHAPYTGASQARAFLAALGGDPAGWLCALDVEAAPTEEYGDTARWAQVKQFIEEWNRLTDGHPLFLYTRKSFWNANIKDGGAPGNAADLGFVGIWTADYTQGGGIWLSNFADKAGDLSFSSTAATPYAGGYAGFERSAILQYGPLRFTDGTDKSLDGNASWMTLAELKALATTSTGTGPGTGNTFVPDVIGEEESVALDELDEADLTAGTRTEDNSDTIAVGAVISTDPVAGTEVATSTAIDYVVSLGPVAPGGSLDPNPPNPCAG